MKGLFKHIEAIAKWCVTSMRLKSVPTRNINIHQQQNSFYSELHTQPTNLWVSMNLQKKHCQFPMELAVCWRGEIILKLPHKKCKLFWYMSTLQEMWLLWWKLKLVTFKLARVSFPRKSYLKWNLSRSYLGKINKEEN